MVKNLADELSDILDWVESPGLGDHAREEAHAGLVIFCRGLVCGLRGGLQVTGDTPISYDEAPAKVLKRREERRRKSENEQRDGSKWDPEAPCQLDGKGRCRIPWRSSSCGRR
jgi:hypothetical protein